MKNVRHFYIPRKKYYFSTPFINVFLVSMPKTCCGVIKGVGGHPFLNVPFAKLNENGKTTLLRRNKN